MSKKEQLPVEVHDHFRKANVLHTYVQESLGEATKHALETGQELLAAKKAVPHGRWENECSRLFDGSLRTAQFYMQFAKDFSQLKSAEKSALLMLEGSLDGAAKAARKAAKPPKPNTPRKGGAPAAVTHDREPASEPTDEPDYGKCPNCHGTEWKEDFEGVVCAKCLHPHGEPPRNGTDKPGDSKPPKQYPRSHWYKQWEQAIGPVVRLVDKIAEEVRERRDPHHDAIQERLNEATEEMAKWMGVKK